jgi:hypothetical protein
MSASNMKWIQSPYFATGDPNTEEMTTLYAPGMLGCAAQFDRGGVSGPPNVCVYQLVKQNNDGAAALFGTVLNWVDKGAWTVDLSLVNSLGLLAGVCQFDGASADTYLWILKKGYGQVRFINSPVEDPSAAGLPVVVSDDTDGVADCLAASQTQAAFPLLGVTTGGPNATPLFEVNVNVPDQY